MALVLPLAASASPGEGAGANAEVLSAAQRAEIQARYRASLSADANDPGASRRFFDSGSVELALTMAQQGDGTSREWAAKSLDKTAQQLDPAWGGVYDSLARGALHHPPFSKALRSQAQAVMLYAYAYRILGDARYLAAARSTASYMSSFLRGTDGAYMSGQSGEAPGGLGTAEYFALDDAARRTKGLPTTFGTSYADENGMVIVALTDLFLTTGDEQSLRNAAAAAEWALARRAVKGGGFRHGGSALEGARVADTAWMGRALLGLYAATGERAWLARAREAAAAAVLDLGRLAPSPRSPAASRCSAAAAAQARGEVSADDALVAARFANGVFRNVGDRIYRQRSLDAYAIARCLQAGAPELLLAADELSAAPLHVTTVGAKDDPSAQALFAASRPIPALYVRREWWDRAEGPLPNPDVNYPRLPKAAAFVCEEQSCSLPLYGADELTSRIAHALSPK